MVTYCYRRPDGEVVERTFARIPEQEKRERIVCEDGVVAERDFTAEHQDNPVRGFYGHLWPMESVAAGVNPQQVPEAEKKAPHHHYNPKNGNMIFHSKKHRRECLRDIGFTDLNSFL